MQHENNFFEPKNIQRQTKHHIDFIAVIYILTWIKILQQFILQCNINKTKEFTYFVALILTKQMDSHTTSV